MPNLFLGFPVSRAAFAEVSGRAVGASLPFDDFYHKTIFYSLDGVQQITSGTGDITISHSSVDLYADSVLNDSAKIQKSRSGGLVPFTWEKNRTARFAIGLESDTDSTLNFWIGTGNIRTGRGLGLYVDSGKLYARAKGASGTTDVEIADLGSSGYFQEYAFKLVFTTGVDCKFYLDGVLKATITTNLPASTTDAKRIYICELANPGSTDSGYLFVYELDVYQKA